MCKQMAWDDRPQTSQDHLFSLVACSSHGISGCSGVVLALGIGNCHRANPNQAPILLVAVSGALLDRQLELLLVT